MTLALADRGEEVFDGLAAGLGEDRAVDGETGRRKMTLQHIERRGRHRRDGRSLHQLDQESSALGFRRITPARCRRTSP